MSERRACERCDRPVEAEGNDLCDSCIEDLEEEASECQCAENRLYGTCGH